jgi:putative sporulation protein YtaF
MYYVSLILLALAVSLDSFSVGFTYGLRKMKIPLKSLLTIASCSAVTLLVAMGVGKGISYILSPAIAEDIGGIVLIVIGAWVLYQFFRPAKSNQEHTDQKVLINFEIKSLGVVIRILRKPMEADFDRSGSITGLEAFMLGVALSMDAFGAGVGAALLGYSPILLAISVAVMSSLFVTAGIRFGRALSEMEWIQKVSFLPGILLILIGIFKI